MEWIQLKGNLTNFGKTQHLGSPKRSCCWSAPEVSIFWSCLPGMLWRRRPKSVFVDKQLCQVWNFGGFFSSSSWFQRKPRGPRAFWWFQHIGFIDAWSCLEEGIAGCQVTFSVRHIEFWPRSAGFLGDVSRLTLVYIDYCYRMYFFFYCNIFNILVAYRY